MAQFVNARHNDLIAGAAFAFFDSGVCNSASFRPQPQPAFGVQHFSGEAPFVYTDGTPNFVPPPPRNIGYFTFPPAHEGQPPPFTFVGQTPPFVQPPPRNNGYMTFGFAWDPGDYKPWSFTKSIVQQIITTAPPRGNAVFISADQRIGTEAPFTLLRPTIGIPTVDTTAIPAFRASFVKAGGWWDLLADAPFFFAAGFATQPPRGPFGRADGVRHLSGEAAYSFTNNTPAVPLTLYVPSQAFALQLPDSSAAFSLTRNSIAISQAGPPGAHFAQGLQLPSDPAPFTFASSLRSITVLKPAAGAFGTYEFPYAAPHTFLREGVPKVIIFRPTGRVLAYQHPADPAPFSFTGQGLPSISIVPVLPASMSTRVFARQWDPDAAPFTFVNIQGLAEGIPFDGVLLQTAIFNLVNAGFEVFVTYGYSTTIPYGFVIAQVPPVGTLLPPFSVITLEASLGLPTSPGPGQTLVPDMTGVTAQTARDQIFAVGLSLGQYSWTISAQTAGTVVDQNPIALSTVPYGTIVQLTLSLGPTVPPPTPTPTPG